MQAIAETLFDIVYLISVVTIGILMIKGCKGNVQYNYLDYGSNTRSWGCISFGPKSNRTLHDRPGRLYCPPGIGKLITSGDYDRIFTFCFYMYGGFATT